MSSLFYNQFMHNFCFKTLLLLGMYSCTFIQFYFLFLQVNENELIETQIIHFQKFILFFSAFIEL